jgi:hypothetical protein
MPTDTSSHDTSFHDRGEPAQRMRHPCCAGPADSIPVADVTHPTPLYRPTLAQDSRETTGRNGPITGSPMTGKGEDQ